MLYLRTVATADDGTVLIPTFGRGETGCGSSFTPVSSNAVVTGLVII